MSEASVPTDGDAGVTDATDDARAGPIRRPRSGSR